MVILMLKGVDETMASQNVWQSVITIAVVVLATMLTRFGAFILFPESKTPPKFVRYLGRVLPSAIMGMLVIYSLGGMSWKLDARGISGVLAVFVVIVLHRWKHNMLVSIFGATALYMLLNQVLAQVC